MPPQMLSFDVEEYFQVEAAAEGGVGPEQWANLPGRLDASVATILELLAAHATRATFFVLGWVARHEAEIVRRIAAAGHEIASHGMTHAMLGRLSPEEFGAELRDSRAILEDLSGEPVIGFRAPTFSITRRTGWALDVLAEAGYRYDSSIFPVHHDRYGVPGAPRWPHVAAGPGGGRIVELPPLTLRILGMNLPTGGGYFRLWPLGWTSAALRAAGAAGRSGMLYLHPWELDPHQPPLPMKATNRWRHRVNLSRTRAKLGRMLERFDFTTAAEFLDAWDAREGTVFAYGGD